MTLHSLHKGFLAATAVAAMVACDRADAPTPMDQNAVVAVDDERLATYVQARYQTDGSIRANDIRVSANDGVVTLRGTVPDQSVRDHAASLAREVDGVLSVDNELQVLGSGAGDAATTSRSVETSPTPRASTDSITPSWITTKIQAQYFVNPEVKPWNIDVTTSHDGSVTLRGEVEETADRDEAARIARETEGVTGVDNQLRVRGETTARETAARDDATAADPAARPTDDPDGWITAKVQAKYFMDTDVRGLSINVDTQDGVVTLSGGVESEGERRQAVAIARNTDGVLSVTDQLQVVPANAKRADSGEPEARRDADLGMDDVWITTKVQSKFFLDDDIKGRDISVDARDGVVYLKGTVESDALKQVAETIARDTDGVTRVENMLKVDTTLTSRQ
jgi:hyperosmotically inducible periplasmic protein